MTNSAMTTTPMSSPHGEDALLAGIQSLLIGRPGVLSTARALSYFAEHALGWLFISAIGIITSKKHRTSWLGMGIGTLLAHASAVILKRIVRRPRPHHPAVVVNVATPSSLSFPSAHTTSTTTATILLGHILRFPVALIAVPIMALSRLVLGVHYPSDVAIGAAIGAIIAKIVTRGERRVSRDI